MLTGSDGPGTVVVDERMNGERHVLSLQRLRVVLYQDLAYRFGKIDGLDAHFNWYGVPRFAVSGVDCNKLRNGATRDLAARATDVPKEGSWS